MALSNIPAFPARSDPGFPAYVDNFFTTTLPNFVTELDETVVGFNNGSFTTTSTTSQTINTTAGKVFTVGAGLSFVKGMWVMVMSTATSDTNNYMVGIVQAYSGSSLTFDSKAVGGTGTIASWRISIVPPILGTSGIGTEAIYTNATGYGTGSDTYIRLIGTLSKNNLVGATVTTVAAEGTVCTINTAGTYAFSYYDTGTTFYLSLNSAVRTAAPVLSERLGLMPTNSTPITRIITLAANAKVRPHAGATGVAANTAAFFSVTRLA